MDPRFGDIRIGAIAISPEALSVSVPHDPFMSGTWAGDMLVNNTVNFGPSGADLFTVVVDDPLSHNVLIELPPSLNVTDPFGVPVAGATAATVAV